MNQGTILGSQIGRWTILAALAAVLAVLLMASGVRAQQDSTISYTEGGTGPVATFEATDPEGMPITWSLAMNANIDGVETADIADGDDHFTLTDGVLRFSASPDFEAPSGEDATSNTYRVVALASDMTGEMMGYRKVIVNVTNVDEAGTVTWAVDHNADTTADEPTLLQFQPGDILTAEVKDGDSSEADKVVDNVLWQWYRSSSKTSLGTIIDGETQASYTVQDAADNNDVGRYIHVKATYQVATKAQESASRASDYPVQATKELQNSLPEFDPTSITREVYEGEAGMTAGAPVTATDADGDVLNYTLAITTGDNAKFEIDQKTGQIKTSAVLDYEADAGEPENCVAENRCVVTVRATDSAGEATGGNDPGDTADVTVTITLKDVNEKPVFSSAAPAAGRIAIMSDEGTTALDSTPANVTYSATDPEGLNVGLTLTGADGDLFGLDASEVLSFKTAPDFENPGDANRDNLYQVTVRASDGTLSTDRMVWIRVNEVNEGPAITGHTTISYAETGTGPVATFEATDPEGMVIYSWSVLEDNAQFTDIEGVETADAADADHFTLMDGVLKFAASPDFEAPRGEDPSDTNTNTYKVVAQADDAMTDAEMGYRKLTVNVTNVDEPGNVTWTVDPDGDTPTLTVENVNDGRPIMQFQPGATLVARVTDGDVVGATMDVTNIQWQWYRSSSRTSLGTPIDGATTATYTVMDTSGNNDVGSYIQVEASYQVSTDNPEIYKASLASDYRVQATKEQQNSLPEFDTAALTKEVNEGGSGMAVGAPVTATDADGDVLNYTLTDAGDAAEFEIDQKSGQITTSVALNYELGDGVAGQCDTANACSVTVTATDSAGAASTEMVTINLMNVDEPPTFSATGGLRAIIRDEGMTALDDTAANVTYTATDPEGQLVALTLMGADGDLFKLVAPTPPATGGILSFKTAPDYENPNDANKDNLYEVTVRASDGTLYTDRMVRVRVNDVDEAPVILQAGLFVSGPESRTYTENIADAVGTYTATGPDAASARWSLEGDDRGDFGLSSSSGMSTMLMFSSSPNYEAPADADTNNVYEVTLKATDGTYTDTQNVMVTVTDDDDPGTVTLSPTSGMVGTAITATLADEDGGVTEVTWQWATSATMGGSFTDIAGATSASYTPAEADAGMYLQATASYSDDYGTGRTADSDAVMVAAGTAVGRYDTNGTPGIQADEVLDVISDYFDPDVTVTESEVLDVIEAYFAS